MSGAGRLRRSARPAFSSKLVAVAAAVLLGLPGCQTQEPAPRAEPLPPGGVLRVITSGNIDSLDPGRMYYAPSWFLARGLYRTLVTYPAAADLAEQNVLVPDLAVDTGQRNEDATRWVFKIRRGIKFGPKIGGEHVAGVTGSEITCPDFKYAIERLFLESVQSGYSFMYEILEGAEVYRAGAADEISGIQCPDPKTIVYELTEPAGDWPYRLAMPGAGPIARKAAARYDRSKERSEYEDHAVATGPYYMLRLDEGRLMRLARNEFWDRETDEVRAANVEGVFWRIGFQTEVAVQKVLDGEFDLTVDSEPTGPQLAALLRDRKLRRRVLSEPQLCTRYIFLNTTEEPFDDVMVRRAVNFAIDRNNLKRILGGSMTGEVAASLAPPGLGGHLPPGEYNPFRTPQMAGDLEKAKRLMARAGYPNGYDGEILMVGATDAPHDRFFESVAADLEQLGFTNIKPKLPPFPNHLLKFYRVPSSNTDVGVSGGWCKDYNDAFTFFDPTFHGDNIRESANLNEAEIDDPVLNELIDRASRTPLGPERTELWEEVNRRATESGAWVPWSWDRTTIVFSERVVNPIYNAFFSHIDWVALELPK
ncbi:MAG TPA: ABC transporter substrate-binding protein [Actinomycetota bacterium]|nr:ABC transporter substrate-binding protein [Actinomycetota bacterium]